MAIFKMTYDLVEGGLAEDVTEALGLTASFPTAPVSSSVSSLSLFAWDCPRFNTEIPHPGQTGHLGTLADL